MKHRHFYWPAALLFAAILGAPVLLWGSAFAQDKGTDKPAAPNLKWEYKALRAADGRRIDERQMEEASTAWGRRGGSVSGP